MATKTKTGFAVCCPFCGDEDATVTIELSNLEECRCSACDETFSPHQARDLMAERMAAWDRVICWVELASTV